MAKSAFVPLINSASNRIVRHGISRADHISNGRIGGVVVHGNSVGRHEISRVGLITSSERDGGIAVNVSPIAIGRRWISRVAMMLTGIVVNVSPSLGCQTTDDGRHHEFLQFLLKVYILQLLHAQQADASLSFYQLTVTQSLLPNFPRQIEHVRKVWTHIQT